MTEWLAESMDLRPGMRVLDLGCGPGSLAAPLARLAGEVVGLDPEPAMLVAAAVSILNTRTATRVEIEA